MALLTAQPISVGTAGTNGVTPSYSAANSSDTVVYDTGLFLHVKNTNGATRLITIVIPGTQVSGAAATDMTHTIAATTGDRMFPIIAEAVDPATGLVTFTTDATAGVTWGVFKR
jgi:hypothetical protein